MIHVKITPAYRVDCIAAVSLPIPAGLAWEQMKNFAWFITLDPFHRHVHIRSSSARPGACLVIDHAFGPLRIARIGQILRWQEGAGYAFTDLSAQGTQVGFPHSYSYSLCAEPRGGCRITLRIRGRWTATAMPRLLVALWLRWIMAQIRLAIHNGMLKEILRDKAAPQLQPCFPLRSA